MNRQRSDLLVLAGLIALGFVLGRFQTIARNAGHTDPISGVVRAAVSPAATTMGSIAFAAGDFVAAATHGQGLEDENRRLRALEASAHAYETDVDRLQREIDELRRLGGWEQSAGRDMVPADVIGIFPNEYRITLSAGADKGLKRGMPVVTYEGMLGRIETVDRSSAQVLLMTSPGLESRISAVVQHAPPQAGLIRGSGVDSLAMELVDPSGKIEVGDVVVTSGFSEQIPRGLVLGKIVAVRDDPAFGKRTAIVSPRVSLGAVREVLVIK